MEEVASDLGFNEDSSLVAEEGEEHCSLEEQQHRQVTLQLLGLGGAHGRGKGAEEEVVGWWQDQIVGQGVSCIVLRTWS